MRNTLHLIALPHTETTSTYLTCAYTMKVVKFCRMLHGRGRKIILYAGAHNDAPCDEHVPLVSEAERLKWFGPWDANDAFSKVTWAPTDMPWQTMNLRAVEAIRQRADPHDLILLTAGTAQQPIAAALPHLLSCEWGVGYEGIFSKFCAFESYAWMHHVYGKRNIVDGRYYDQVIPNFFDPSEFSLSEKGDYLLFIGRLTARKGPHIAAQVAKACGMKLVVAGPGAKSVTRWPGGGTTIVGDQVRVEGPHVEYVGAVGVKDRAELMAKARAVLVPTLYLEPFGGVAVEAMLSGTPAVTSDWGAFSETVEGGVTGYRFRTLQQGVDAVRRTIELDPKAIRRRALKRFSLDAVRPLYERWFDQLDGLWGEGWPALRQKGAA